MNYTNTRRRGGNGVGNGGALGALSGYSGFNNGMVIWTPIFIPEGMDVTMLSTVPLGLIPQPMFETVLGNDLGSTINESVAPQVFPPLPNALGMGYDWMGLDYTPDDAFLPGLTDGFTETIGDLPGLVDSTAHQPALLTETLANIQAEVSNQEWLISDNGSVSTDSLTPATSAMTSSPAATTPASSIHMPSSHTSPEDVPMSLQYEESPEPDAKAPLGICPVCPTTTAAVRDINRHLWQYHPDYAEQHKIKCEWAYCPAKCGLYSRRDNLKRHYKAKHGGTLSWKNNTPHISPAAI